MSNPIINELFKPTDPSSDGSVLHSNFSNQSCNNISVHTTHGIENSSALFWLLQYDIVDRKELYPLRRNLCELRRGRLDI